METTLELFKENMKFSAGHFTIFGPDKRERLHGHNFTVAVAITSEVGEDGLVSDYGVLKRRLVEICDEWNEIFLLPGRSRHLHISEDDTHVVVTFAGEQITFPKGDVLILPLVNVTLEELSRLFLEKVRGLLVETRHTGIRALEVKVFSGPGQSAAATWTLAR